jgi:hypothetical protein
MAQSHRRGICWSTWAVSRFLQPGAVGYSACDVIAELLGEERCTRRCRITRELDLAFTKLAAERIDRHALRSYVWIPMARTAAMWFTPRIAILPYSGQLWPRSHGWQQGPTGFAITLGLTLLNFLYAGLALLLYWRQCPGIALIVAFIVVRTAFSTQLQTCEPRYVLECVPALLALGAQSWRNRLGMAWDCDAPAIYVFGSRRPRRSIVISK